MCIFECPDTEQQRHAALCLGDTIDRYLLVQGSECARGLGTDKAAIAICICDALLYLKICR